MSKETKFVYLSNKSLKRVWEWSKENEAFDPLAKAFFDTCGALGFLLDAQDNNFKILHGYSDKKAVTEFRKIISTIRNNDDVLIQQRDLIGRIILNMLNRQEKKLR